MDSTEEAVREQVQAEVSDDKIARLAERLGATAAASAVFGTPVEQEGVTVIPVARARWGIGGGSGKGKGGEDKGSGVGGGANTTPVGFIELKAEGVEYRRINDPLRYIVALLVMPFVMALSAMMVMLTAAVIAALIMRRMLAVAGNFRLPLPHLTFHS